MFIIYSLNVLNGYFIYQPTQAPTAAPPPCEARSLTAHIRLGLFGISVSSWRTLKSPFFKKLKRLYRAKLAIKKKFRKC